jgi:hypothetical protein
VKEEEARGQTRRMKESNVIQNIQSGSARYKGLRAPKRVTIPVVKQRSPQRIP